MNKVIALLLITIGASLSAGVYGSLHDLVTYNISPEYYTYYKFIDFGLTESSNDFVADPYLLAAIAGFMATWWVGFILGLVIGGIVLIFSDSSTKELVRFVTGNTLLILSIVLACGIIGFLCGLIMVSSSPESFAIDDILLTPEQARNFTIVSFIHSFGYFGSAVGFAVAVIRTFKQLKQANAATPV